MNSILVVLGGGAGALFRYLSVLAVDGLFSGRFLFGTIFVNCAGSLLIGFFMNAFGTFSANPKLKLFIITGFLGGYTTFSAYSYETADYLMTGNIKYAVMNIALSNVLCIAFVFLGIWLGRAVFVKP